MSTEKRVLVVGTTPDYIQWIRERFAGQALFVTDPVSRRQAREPVPEASEEILCDLERADAVRAAVERHLSAHRLRLSGIACFDCESMALAATLAEGFRLPYPSPAAVQNCRDKYRSRELWRQNGLETPEARRLTRQQDAVDFFRELGVPCVLKPPDGSGSELVFFCPDEEACRRQYARIAEGLRNRRDHRLFTGSSGGHPVILAERAVTGTEYSADFILGNNQVHLIRITQKVIDDTVCFGTARGYLLIAGMPDGTEESRLKDTFCRAARALGLSRALCMVDFIVEEGMIVLLEMTPRPGGDCLPFLIQRAKSLDMLGLMLAFSRGDDVLPETNAPETAMAGLRLHAAQPGVLQRVDTRGLEKDPRIREIHLIREAGHLVVMPPADYDSWYLGHVLFAPDAGDDPESQCAALARQVVVEVR